MLHCAQVPNKIDELCRNIRMEIDSRVQDVLDNLSKDCQALTKLVDEKVTTLEFVAHFQCRASST